MKLFSAKIFRSILGIALLASVFWFVDAQELLQVFRGLRWLSIFWLALVALVMIWVSCIKWRLFIRSGGHDAPLSYLMYLYTVGYFFNLFMPSSVGGDVARSVHLGKRLSSQRQAFVSTFLERFTGLLAMALLGFLFVLVGAPATAGVRMAVLLVTLVCVALAFVCFSEHVGRWTSRLASLCAQRFLPEKFAATFLRYLSKLDEAFTAARADKVLMFKALALSFVFHGLTVINSYVAAEAIGWMNPDIAGLFVVVPLVLLVSMIPLTPNGIGLQEGAFLFFLQRIGGTREQALAVGLVLRAKVMVIALLGGLLWLASKREKASAEQV